MPMHLSKRPLLTLLAACALSGLVSRAEMIPAAAPAPPPATTPEALQQRLEGKTVFLRGFYVDDKLQFDTQGKVEGNPTHGSFTLSGLQIRKVRFTKKTMELEADRIGLHFFGAIPYENDAKPYEVIKVSKKPVEISIDRLVIEPEKKKKKGKDAKEVAKAAKPDTAPADAREGVAATDDSEGTVTTVAEVPGAPAIAPNHDPRESYVTLSSAIEKIFSPALDQSIIASLPDYWQNYFATQAGKKQAAAVEAAALHLGPDVRAPHLLTAIDPDSNDYAQKNNIAGMILLQTVVSSNGKPGDVTILRPIGFGLDEKAVEAVEKSHFQPGMKDGKAVPVVINLAVTFRIYSDKTRPHSGAPAAPTQVAPKVAPAPASPKDAPTTVAAARVDG